MASGSGEEAGGGGVVVRAGSREIGSIATGEVLPGATRSSMRPSGATCGIEAVVGVGEGERRLLGSDSSVDEEGPRTS